MRKVKLKYKDRSNILVAFKQTASQNVKNPSPIKTLDICATLSEAREIAERMGSRLPTLSEFIRALKYDPKLYEKVKGDWYWVNDQPEFTIPGYYRINYERGSISIVSPFDLKNIPLDERAYVWRCDGMLMLLIKGDDASRRLELGGSDIFDGVPVAVAVINVSDMEKVMAKGREAIQRLKRGIK